jgi:transcription-repair coupling factor (superfamily II helicase)
MSSLLEKSGLSLWSRFSRTPAAEELRQRLEREKSFACAGVSRAAQPFLGALLQKLARERPVLLVTEGVKSQEQFHQDVQTYLALDAGETADGKGPELLFFPGWDILPHEARLPHADVISERLETLVALSPHTGHASKLIVANIQALLQRTFSPGEVEKRTRGVSKGDHLDPLDLVEWLEGEGYEPEAQVSQKGEMALRGGILDVFPLASAWPVRIEFFGNEIESLRLFDPVTQISREEIPSMTLPPGGELGLIRQQVAGEQLPLGEAPRNAFCTLLDHLPDGTVVVFFEPELILENVRLYSSQVQEGGERFFLNWEEFWKGLGQRQFSVLNVAEGMEDLGASSAGELWMGFRDLEAFRPIGGRPMEAPLAEEQRRQFFNQLHRWLRQGYGVEVVCNNEGEQQRFLELWNDYGLAASALAAREEDGKKKESVPEAPSTRLGALSRGFVSEEARLVVVSDAEIFGRYKTQRPRRLKSPHAAAMRSAFDIDFTELEEGDYVVHLEHGIGRFQGLQLLPSSPAKRGSAPAPQEAGQECLVIEYAAGNPEQPSPRLYVPVTEAHLVSKYVGAGKARPPLNTLGGGRWAKAKAHAERAVRDLAAELLEIQAARDSQEGHAFGLDTPWQREFESAFIYEETPDQFRAIEAAKKDMESARPMDRLICGDVGFGKTEVAIRAAFKAVMGGAQVAVLVPTTILAQQHFNNFRERMADYPVLIEQLSRFRSKAAQKKILAQMAEGTIDIVVGTHRLLQQDVEFKNLGLVVIDEEQRFGVLHKEKFKRLRKLVDVLTLSATPIPRTLYLALTGARDLSTIETPPQDRLPVETIVAQYDERIIRDAIQRELNRGGQVYFLHNRVLDIQTMAARIQNLVPAARIVVGHGQMQSDELEEVMVRFINGEADVLVSTTIIESGIDIQNANTIIINRADRFGLSDLYQLRGRVGRYKHQAYAYLLLPRHASLLQDVRKRISAIKQYSSLGSGFKIAMRDLEIRGAGNLLGPEQSGHITAVGFELYCQLLKQSVSALKGEKPQRRIEVQVRLDFLALQPEEQEESVPEKPRAKSRSADLTVSVPRDVAIRTSHPERAASSFDSPVPTRKTPAYLPFSYIPEARHRIEIYRKLAQVTGQASLEQLRAEIRDRFGELPPAVQLLLQLAELKLLAGQRGISLIESKQEKIMLFRAGDYLTMGGKFPRFRRKDAKSKLNEIKKLLLGIQLEKDGVA